MFTWVSKSYLFKSLTAHEEGEMRKWARDNYISTTQEIHGVWHPVVRDECVKILLEQTREDS